MNATSIEPIPRADPAADVDDGGRSRRVQGCGVCGGRNARRHDGDQGTA